MDGVAEGDLKQNKIEKVKNFLLLTKIPNKAILTEKFH